MKTINFLLDIRKNENQLPEHELLVTAYIKIHTVYNLFNTVYVILVRQIICDVIRIPVLHLDSFNLLFVSQVSYHLMFNAVKPLTSVAQ